MMKPVVANAPAAYVVNKGLSLRRKTSQSSRDKADKRGDHRTSKLAKLISHKITTAPALMQWHVQLTQRHPQVERDHRQGDILRKSQTDQI